MPIPSGLEHLIVLTLENRSFDHVLGALGHDAQWRRNHPNERVEGLDPAKPFENLALDGKTIHKTKPFEATHPRRYRWAHDPPHGADLVNRQIAKPRPGDPRSEMGGFVEAFERKHKNVPERGDILRYYRREDLPVTYHLADHFVVCDHWYSPIAGDTFPNRLYALCGDSGGIESTDFDWDLVVGAKCTSVFEQMENFKDSRAMYSGVLSMGMALPKVRSLIRYTHGRPDSKSRWLSQLAVDIANDALPRLSWVEPTYAWRTGKLKLLPTDPRFREPCCDHPPADVAEGQALIHWIYEVLRSNEKVWQKSALVITYDEHGGFFDHVAPPEIHEVERNKDVHNRPTDRFTRRGPRVPAFVVSPWVKPRVVHDRMDHCSILKFLCEWLGIPKWTDRIASPRIASLDVVFESKLDKRPPKPCPLPPPPTPKPRSTPADAEPEPDLGPWLSAINDAIERPGQAGFSDARLARELLPRTRTRGGDDANAPPPPTVLGTVATPDGTPRAAHVEVDDIDATLATVPDYKTVGKAVIDGRRTVSAIDQFEHRLVLWERAAPPKSPKPRARGTKPARPRGKR
jgi:hypothetical protein